MSNLVSASTVATQPSIELRIGSPKTPMPFLIPFKKAQDRKVLMAIIYARTESAKKMNITMYGWGMKLIHWDDWEDLVQPKGWYFADINNQWLISRSTTKEGTNPDAIERYLRTFEAGKDMPPPPRALPPPEKPPVHPATDPLAKAPQADQPLSPALPAKQAKVDKMVVTGTGEKPVDVGGSRPTPKSSIPPKNVSAQAPQPAGRATAPEPAIREQGPQVTPKNASRPKKKYQGKYITASSDSDDADNIHAIANQRDSSGNPLVWENTALQAAVEEARESIRQPAPAEFPIGTESYYTVPASQIAQSQAARDQEARRQVAQGKASTQSIAIAQISAPVQDEVEELSDAGSEDKDEVASGGASDEDDGDYEEGAEEGDDEEDNDEDNDEEENVEEENVEEENVEEENVEEENEDEEYADDEAEDINEEVDEQTKVGEELEVPVAPADPIRRMEFLLIKPIHRNGRILNDVESRIIIKIPDSSSPASFIRGLRKASKWTKLLVLGPNEQGTHYRVVDVLKPNTPMWKTPFTTLGWPQQGMTVSWEHMENSPDPERLNPETCCWDKPGKDISMKKNKKKKRN